MFEFLHVPLSPVILLLTRSDNAHSTLPYSPPLEEVEHKNRNNKDRNASDGTCGTSV